LGRDVDRLCLDRSPDLYLAEEVIGNEDAAYVKWAYLIIGLVAVAGSFVFFRSAEEWTEVVKDDSVTIKIERALYENQGFSDFYIHVRAINTTNRPLGIDFRDRWLAVYPNQWASSDLDHRTEINEQRLLPKKLDEVRLRETLNAFRSRGLIIVPAHEKFDYYINFNGERSDREIKNQSRKFLLISIKGQMFFTNGVQVWDKQADTELVLKEPVKWKKIPNGGGVLVITR
jgi:hypothetical protein